jgi:hypothetical protein
MPLRLRACNACERLKDDKPITDLKDGVSSSFAILHKNVLFKRKQRMHRSVKREGTRKGTLAGTGGQKGGMFGESNGPVDNIPSDASLGGN